jgi:hypothetical protein
MCTLINSVLSRMGFTVAIIVFSITTLAFVGSAAAKDRLKPQKQYTPAQSACFPSFGTTTVTARRSGRPVQVQSSTCTSGGGKTTVTARPFGSENDKYVCVGECRVVRMCLLQYCYNETVCDPCVRVVVVIGPD